MEDTSTNTSTENNTSTDTSTNTSTKEVVDSGITLTLEQELIADLTDELSEDEMFNEKILLSKIRSALREVKRARNYPSTYTDDMIDNDMYDYYSNIRNIALYDYNLVGGEFEESHSENSINRSFVDRNKLFSGIVPLARF